jgi:hypothetical protein
MNARTKDFQLNYALLEGAQQIEGFDSEAEAMRRVAELKETGRLRFAYLRTRRGKVTHLGPILKLPND